MTTLQTAVPVSRQRQKPEKGAARQVYRQADEEKKPGGDVGLRGSLRCGAPKAVSMLMKKIQETRRG